MSKIKYGREGPGYSWTQTEKDVIVTMPIPQGTKSRDIDYQIKASHLRLGLKGKPPVIDGDLFDRVLVDECCWIIEGSNVELTLTKSVRDSEHPWWKSVIVGHPEIDTEIIEARKYIDDSLLDKIAERDEALRQEKEQQQQQQEQEQQQQQEQEQEQEQGQAAPETEATPVN